MISSRNEEVLQVTVNLKDGYDRFIQAQPHGHFRQGVSWTEIIAYNSETTRLTVHRAGEIVAAMSIERRRLPATTYSYLYAAQGPVVDFADRQAVRALLDATRRLAKASRAVFLRVDPDVVDEDDLVRNCLRAHGFRYLDGKNWSYFNYPRILMRVDIAPDEASILKGMRKKHRQHINTGPKKGISHLVVTDLAGVTAFYEMMTALAVRKGFPVRDFEYYKRLYEVFGPNGRMLLARHDDKWVAGVFAIVYGRRAWYLHGASADDRGNVHPNEGLHWDMIRWAKSHGCSSYDLGGAGTDYPPDEKSPNYDLYRFKQGFGAEIVYLTGYYDLVFAPAAYGAFRWAEEKLLPAGMGAYSSLRKFARRWTGRGLTGGRADDDSKSQEPGRPEGARDDHERGRPREH